MNFKNFLISQLARALLGGIDWARIKNVVSNLNNESIPGKLKRDAALHELRIVGVSLAESLLNLGIELAVTWLKTKGDSNG